MLPPPDERNEWRRAQQAAASQRLAVITGIHPHAFPILGDLAQAWDWYRDNNPAPLLFYRAVTGSSYCRQVR